MNPISTAWNSFALWSNDNLGTNFDVSLNTYPGGDDDYSPTNLAQSIGQGIASVEQQVLPSETEVVLGVIAVIVVLVLIFLILAKAEAV